MRPADLAQRAKNIRLPKQELASLSGVHEDTVGRVLNEDTGTKLETLDKIEGALVAEEQRLLDYLGGLHGRPRRARAATIGVAAGERAAS